MRYLLALAFILSIPCVSMADEDEDPYQVRRHLPTVKTTVIEGKSYKCLDKDQWKTVMLIALDYQGLFDWRLKIRGVLEAHDQILETYELKISNYESMLKAQEANVGYYKTRLKDVEDRLGMGNIEDRLEKYALWAVVLIETVTIAVMGIKSYADAN